MTWQILELATELDQIVIHIYFRCEKGQQASPNKQCILFIDKYFDQLGLSEQT